MTEALGEHVTSAAAPITGWLEELTSLVFILSAALIVWLLSKVSSYKSEPCTLVSLHPDDVQPHHHHKPDSATSTKFMRAVHLACCAVALHACFLPWGLVQEYLMTKAGGDSKLDISMLLVFVSRLGSMTISFGYLLITSQLQSPAPFDATFYCALSELLASWLQLEALKYVSFPLQVLSKACKLVPVMITGYFISGRVYSRSDYAVACLISVGVLAFLTGNEQTMKAAADTSVTAGGSLLLALYLCANSFTSNWEEKIFKEFKLSSVHMLFSSSLFACSISVGYLLLRGVALPPPDLTPQMLLFAVASTAGGFVILHTIREFGALIFVIIMTLRQVLAILLSCFVYSHPVTPLGFLGVAAVFAGISTQIWYKWTAPPAPSSQPVHGANSCSWLAIIFAFA